MDRHVVTFATDLLLAGPVKVELFQLIGLPGYGDVTSRNVIDHDGMPVINDMQRGRLVIELDRRQICVAGTANIDGRLAMASLARNKLRLQIAPMVGSLRSAIAPGVLRLMLLGRAGCRRRKRPQHHYKQKVVSIPRMTSCSFATFQWPRLTTVRAHKKLAKILGRASAIHAEPFFAGIFARER